MSERNISIRLASLLLLAVAASSQTQTTGRIAGIVRDSQGAAIVGAAISVENPATTDKHTTVSEDSGNFSVPFLPPASYELRIEARGFAAAVFHNISVRLSETATVNAVLQLAHTSIEVNVTGAPPLVRSDSSELSTTLDSHTITELPLPTRNFLQLLTLAPGVSAPLTNNNAVGRNSPNVSVNGARVTQNNYQINGVDGNDISLHVFADVAVPAPESVSEINVQTSMYDASVAGTGGSVQVVGKSGSNFLHGSIYEYFRNEVFNANDANLRAVGDPRPEMRRNVYGATLGGPIRKNKAFFFGSYQGSRDANGATNGSVYKSVLIAPGLTNDRSAGTLMSTFKVPSVDPITLKLLNLKLPNGKYLIPTPPTPDGLATGSALSTYHEEQFNTNLDYRLGSKDSLSGKFFFANAQLFSALGGANFGFGFASFPGFGTSVLVNNRTLSVQEIHTFSPALVNESRLGYSSLRHGELPQESVDDTSLGIQRSTADKYPGLPLIVMGLNEGGAAIGTSTITYRGSTPSLSFADILSLQRGNHNLRLGGEIQRYEWRARAAVFSYGELDFPTFQDFLIGNTGDSQFAEGTFGFAHLGTGLQDRDFLTTDYHLFIQDDWKVSPRFTINLGLRYELDLPPYDTQGRIGGFDPVLYKPRMEVSDDFPAGPPLQGIVEAGNALPQYSLPGVLRVGKRMAKSIDPNNFGPRIGLAWSPLRSARLALRGGYGIFFARPSFFNHALEIFNPPFFVDSVTSGQPFNSPFATAPLEANFPLLEPGSLVGGWATDRNVRTPYYQQFNASLQYSLSRDMTFQIAYTGSRGLKLYRLVNVNQARIASLNHPIRNAVTGKVITDNTIENASLRAPMQEVRPDFSLNQTTAQSTYHSLQTTLNRRFAGGLQFSASYTFSRSIDNASNPGWGPGAGGGGFDTASLFGNQLTDRGNRGLSDFDCTHRFVASYIWDLPAPSFAHGSPAHLLLSHWQLSGIVTAMSAVPTDIIDPGGGFLYGQFGSRPNWAPGASRRTALTNIPPGYYFNPAAFTVATVQPGEPIPSAHDPTALTGDTGTDIGNVGRNVLRGPSQSDVDFSIAKRFVLTESKDLRFQADFFNLLNHANQDGPVNDINAGDFGRSVSISSSPRIVQLSLKFNF